MKHLIFIVLSSLLIASCSTTTYEAGVVNNQEMISKGSDPSAHIDTSKYQRTYVAYTEYSNKILVYDKYGDLIWQSTYCNNLDFRLSVFGLLILIVLVLYTGYSLKQ